MIKKNTIYATIALITSSCASSGSMDAYELSAANAATKISAENQQAYFACKFERHETPCRQKIWDTHPHPELKGGITRETIPNFFQEVEKRGAGRVLDKQGYKCGEPTEVHDMFWERGYNVTCADGKEYRIDRLDGNWRITQAPKKL